MTLQRSRLVRTGGAVTAAWLVVLAANRSLRRVTGESMLPTLVAGDLVLAVRWPRPRVGDVVVARDPRDGRPWVKRLAVVGPGTLDAPFGRVDVPAGQVLLLGDNPAASTDGRLLGPTPAADVSHRVVAVVARRGSSGGRPLRRVRNRARSAGV